MTQPLTQNQSPKKTRRAMLEEFVAAHPADGFARYGLAMECASTGDTTAAVENYETLLASHPQYVSGYFQYGQLLARLSRIDDARRILTSGIEAGRRSGDEHAASEMETALAQL
jgi:tetratricopeptide (TPR) repeat protein